MARKKIGKGHKQSRAKSHRIGKAMAKAAHARSKKTATSKSGKKYKRSASSKTGWVAVTSYKRSKPTRRATAAEKRTHSCASTRRAKTGGHAKKRGKK